MQHSLLWPLGWLPLVSPREQASGVCDDEGVGDDTAGASKSEKLAFGDKVAGDDFDESTNREELTSETLLTSHKLLDAHALGLLRWWLVKELFQMCVHVFEHFKVEGEIVAYKSWKESLPRSLSGCPIGTCSGNWSSACTPSLNTLAEWTLSIQVLQTTVLDDSDVYVRASRAGAQTSLQLTGLGNLKVAKRGFVWTARLGSAIHLLVPLLVLFIPPDLL